MRAHHLLRLLAIPRVGPLKVQALVRHFGDPERIFSASPRELVRIQGIDERIAVAIVHDGDARRFAEGQMSLAARIGVNVVTAWDDAYPERLKRIYDPPPVLFAKGQCHRMQGNGVAIVGTRQPSAYGSGVAHRLSTDLCARGFAVVSGLARGIDTVAHQAALDARGTTIAVVGSGLDIPYPPENRGLLARIAESGVVCSELPLGTRPDPQNFPRRNRIISGLSIGTVVVESAIDGGAMITASTALDQNREVFAVPGRIDDPRSAGPHLLIQQGRAKLIRSIDDIVDECGGPAGPSPAPTAIAVSLFEQRVLDVLDNTPQFIDAVAEKCAMHTGDILVHLLALEFKGLVRQLPGKHFTKA